MHLRFLMDISDILVEDSSQTQINGSDLSNFQVRNLKSGEDILAYILNIRTSMGYSLRTACVMNRVMKVAPLNFDIFSVSIYFCYIILLSK